MRLRRMHMTKINRLYIYLHMGQFLGHPVVNSKAVCPSVQIIPVFKDLIRPVLREGIVCMLQRFSLLKIKASLLSKS